MATQPIYLEESEFEYKFSIVEENDEDVRFSTIKELEKANIENKATIWTATETDGKLSFESGIRRVNVLFYFLTDEPVEDGMEYVVNCDY
jgi:hypothetical protein